MAFKLELDSRLLIPAPSVEEPEAGSPTAKDWPHPEVDQHSQATANLVAAHLSSATIIVKGQACSIFAEAIDDSDPGAAKD